MGSSNSKEEVTGNDLTESEQENTEKDDSKDEREQDCELMSVETQEKDDTVPDVIDNKAESNGNKAYGKESANNKSKGMVDKGRDKNNGNAKANGKSKAKVQTSAKTGQNSVKTKQMNAGKSQNSQQTNDSKISNNTKVQHKKSQDKDITCKKSQFENGGKSKVEDKASASKLNDDLGKEDSSLGSLNRQDTQLTSVRSSNNLQNDVSFSDDNSDDSLSSSSSTYSDGEISEFEDVEDDLDVEIMKRKEALFEKHFVWDSQTKLDVIKSGIFPLDTMIKIKCIKDKQQAYQALIEALKISDGIEDMVDLASALQFTNALVAAELTAEAEVAIGETKIEDSVHREAVKSVRLHFGRQELHREDENKVIALIAQRTQVAKQVWKKQCEQATSQVKNYRKDAGDFTKHRLDRLSGSLLLQMQKHNYQCKKKGNSSGKSEKQTNGTSKKANKQGKGEENDDVKSTYDDLDNSFAQFTNFLKSIDSDKKKLRDELSLVKTKILKNKKLSDSEVCDAIDELLREKAEEVEKNARDRNIPVTDDELKALENEKKETRENVKEKQLDSNHQKHIDDLQAEFKKIEKQLDTAKKKRNDIRSDLKETIKELELTKSKVERLEKILAPVLKNIDIENIVSE